MSLTVSLNTKTVGSNLYNIFAVSSPVMLNVNKSGYFGNTHPNYYVEFQIYDGSNVLLSEFKLRPKSDGSFHEKNISHYLAPHLTAEYSPTHTSPVNMSATSYFTFYFKYREIDNSNGVGAYVTLSSFGACLASKQQGDANDGALVKYTGKINKSITADEPARMLSGFDVVRYWSGKKQSLSMLMHDGAAGFAGLEIRATSIEANKGGTPETSSLDGGARGLHHIDLSTALAGMSAGRAWVWLWDVVNSKVISEIKEVEIITDYCDDGVFVSWLNDLGGWDYWNFSDRITKSQKNKSFAASSYQKKMSESLGAVRVYKKEVVETWTFGAVSIPMIYAEGLAGLYGSTSVFELDELGVPSRYLIISSPNVEYYDSKAPARDFNFAAVIPSLFRPRA